MIYSFEHYHVSRVLRDVFNGKGLLLSIRGQHEVGRFVIVLRITYSLPAAPALLVLVFSSISHSFYPGSSSSNSCHDCRVPTKPTGCSPNTIRNQTYCCCCYHLSQVMARAPRDSTAGIASSNRFSRFVFSFRAVLQPLGLHIKVTTLCLERVRVCNYS